MAKTRKQVAILLNLNCGFHRQIARGIAKYAGPHDTWLLSVAEHSAETVAALIDWPGDGLIIDLDVRQVDQAVSLFQGEVVGVGTVAPRVLKRLNISTVRTDDRTIAEWAADHLLEQGLEQFAYCGVSRPGRDHWATARRSAFCRRIAEHGRPCAIFAARYDAAQSCATRKAGCRSGSGAFPSRWASWPAMTSRGVASWKLAAAWTSACQTKWP